MLNYIYSEFFALFGDVLTSLAIPYGNVVIGSVAYTNFVPNLATIAVGFLALPLLAFPFALLFKLINFVTGGYSR